MTLRIPLEEDTKVRRALIELRRDVHNRRQARPSAVAVGCDALRGEIGNYQTLDLRIRELESHIDTEAADGGSDELAILRRWAADVDVQRGLALSSDALLHSLNRLAGEATAHPTGRTRKAMPSMVTYFGRSTAKVSPFSRHTVIALGPRPDTVANGIRSEITTSRVLYRMLLRQLAASSETKQQIGWRLSDLFRSSSAPLSWTRRVWSGRGGPVDEFSEEIVNFPATPAWEGLVMGLRSLPAVEHSYQSLVESLRTSTGAPGAEEIVNRLIGIGVFVPVAPVSEQATDFEEKWQRFLEGLSGNLAEKYRDAHRATMGVRRGLADASGPTRAELIGQIRARWTELLELEDRGEKRRSFTNLFYEDAYCDEFTDLDPEIQGTWAADLALLLPVLHGLDEQRIIDAALLDSFRERFGPGGKCDDILSFAQGLRDDLPKRMAIMRSSDDPLAAFRRSAVKLFSQWNGSEADIVEIDPADLNELSRSLHGLGQDRTRSFAIFGQRHGNDLVLNHVYGGEGRFVSRFLSAAPDGYREMVSDYVRSFTGPGAIPAQLRPTLGFNANLSPSLLDLDIAPPDDTTHSPSVSAAELMLREENGALLVESRDGRSVDVKYLGFLVPYALPSLELLLACSGGVPYLSFGEIAADMVARRTGDEVITAPRITVGSLVVLRRRWAVPTATVVSLLDDGKAAFRRLNEWRLEQKMPEMVFVRDLPKPLDPMKDGRGPKPMLVDFMSQLHGITLARRLEDFGDQILFEECLPTPDTSEHRSARGTHASEWYFEMNDFRGNTDDLYASPESSR
ncbi:lantibiotic dehydratase [Arthrobacter terricola]|uniref:lantibiotic dehydratase n=1 Tax=Arthrobacter terricola TaxID=2547396 RepID=UPI00140551AD|nr:lantibiotic dehydratase [Arthrobacter terricola]